MYWFHCKAVFVSFTKSECLYYIVVLTEGKEIGEDGLKHETSSLTRAQAAAVKKRVDTLNATVRKKQKQQHKTHVKDVFAPPDVS